MSNLIMWNLIVGFLAPNVIALLQQPKWPSQVRSLIMFAFAIVAGGVTAYLNDQWNTTDIIGSILVVGVTAISFYKGLWKPTGVATSIENMTSPTPPTVEQAHPDDAPTPGVVGGGDAPPVYPPAAYPASAPPPAPPQHKDDSGQSAGYIALVVLAIIGVVALIIWLVPELRG